MKNNTRKHDRVYLNVSNISMSAVVAIIATINNQGYMASVNDLHQYDVDNDSFAFDVEMRLTSQFDIYAHSSDWARMRKTCAAIYAIVKKDVLARRYSSAAIALSFYRDSDDSMVHHYTDFIVDYSLGDNDGAVRFVRLR